MSFMFLLRPTSFSDFSYVDANAILHMIYANFDMLYVLIIAKSNFMFDQFFLLRKFKIHCLKPKTSSFKLSKFQLKAQN